MKASNKYENYKLVSTKLDLMGAIKTLGSGPCALDFETTSLSPAHGRVRLVQLFDGKHGYVVDFDKIKGGFRAVASLFSKGEWIVFNSNFELRWFIDAGAPKTRCRDVAFLRCAILGGGRLSLKQCVQWDLKREMDKTEQASNWGAAELTDSQLHYAFKDAVDTWDLFQHWQAKSDLQHMRAWAMFDNMVPAIIEMEEAGMLLDVPRHEKLDAHWRAIAKVKVAAVRAIVGEDEVANINSNAQWSDFFARIMPDGVLKAWPRTEKSGQLQTTTAVLRSIAVQFEQADGPNAVTDLLDALADYKKIEKYIGSFGASIITKAQLSPDKRVRARFNIAAAKTGRFSSSNPNLQQVPRDNELLGEATSVRTSFMAKLGRKLVSLDYSGIELRVLALLADDKQLLEDVVYGDVHAEVAAVIAGHPIDKKTPDGKKARTAAKGVSFGIIYGSAAAGLSVNMRTSEAKAQSYIDFWATRYKNAFDYRNKMMQEARRTRYIRVIDGGTIYMGKAPETPKCANYPVQRAALSVMACAIARHKNSLDAERAAGRQKYTKMLSTIHDALIDEAASRDAQKCLQIMEQDMTAGYLDVFPKGPTHGLVEGGIGPNWGQLD
jgi:DNA polymerase I